MISTHLTKEELARKLRESEENLKVYVEDAPDGIYLTDLKGNFLYGNKQAEEITGYTKQELMGKSFLNLNLLPPKYLPKAIKLLTLNAAGKTTGPDTFELVRKDGRKIWIEIKTKPIEQFGKTVVIGFVRDIAERKRTDEEWKKMTDALQISEARYKDLYENAPIVYYSVGTDGSLKGSNKAAQLWLGFSPDELRRMSIFDIYAEESRARVRTLFARFQQGISSENEELVYQRKNGEKVYGLLTFSVVRDEGGQVVASRSVVKDITEYKRAEETLRESEESYRSLFKNMINGYALCKILVDEENKPVDFLYIDVNEAFEKLTGLKKEDVIGKKVTEAIPSIKASNPELIPIYGEVAATGKPIAFEVLIKSLDIWLAISVYSPRKDYFVAVFDNITERKNMEKQLKRAAEEWRNTFDSITDLVSIQDKDFKLVRVNKAFANAFGASPKELIGKHCYEVVHKTNVPYPNCPHKRTLKTMAAASAEFLEPSLGIYLEVATSPLSAGKGRHLGSVHVARDINERKRMQEQLMLADRLSSIGELASGVAHELNNPLTSVIGFSQLLLEKELPDEIKEDLSLVNSEAQRAAAVVKNLLTFARKHTPAKQLCQIHNIIEDVLKLRAYEQTVSNITVDRQFAVDLPEITIDYFQMQQVFLNIIVNAEFAMTEAHRNGKITITTQRLDNTVRVSFADNGPGIPKENLSRLFDPFFTTKEVGKGTGLGLSICHGIVSEHGGKIYARSQLGKGATFVVELPVTNGH